MLNPYVFYFLIHIHQLVSHLHRQSKGEVGLLYRGEHFSRIHVSAAEHRFDRLVGLQLHRVDLLNRINQHVLKRRAASLIAADLRRCRRRQRLSDRDVVNAVHDSDTCVILSEAKDLLCGEVLRCAQNDNLLTR